MHVLTTASPSFPRPLQVRERLAARKHGLRERFAAEPAAAAGAPAASGGVAGGLLSSDGNAGDERGRARRGLFPALAAVARSQSPEAIADARGLTADAAATEAAAAEGGAASDLADGWAALMLMPRSASGLDSSLGRPLVSREGDALDAAVDATVHAPASAAARAASAAAASGIGVAARAADQSSR